ncbi:hypothetical protein Pint_21460 [Pistacia integerrima]|uniref:Uncharacterized protein n=1 Tax=Pistacia integerrima TaxID=434235 RepID=A0ACC0XCD4_9ROSI|nr:hypothetical protein Pint_21460 [Pistacia integerrima]
MLLLNNALKTLHVHTRRVASRTVCEYHFPLKRSQCTYHSPTNPTHVNLLTIASNSKSLLQTKQTHAFARLNGFLPGSVSLCATLILRYASFQEPNACFLLFEQTINYCHTAFLWNTFIRALSVACVHDGFVTYNRMVRTGVSPDHHTFPFVLKACANNLELQKGMEIHGHLLKLGFETNVFVGLTPNSIAISSILHVLVELELFSLGKEIHGFSLRMGIESDVFVANSLINMYAKSGHPSEASYVFHYMPVKDVVTWNAMITNLTQNGLLFAALELVRAMAVHNKIPDSVTLTSVIPTCARGGFLRQGKEIHAVTIRMGFNFDLFVTNALTDMYAKCGCLDLAQRVFDISLRDELSYNILIASYAETSDCSKSLSLFSEMGLIGMMHDVVSFVGAISACANLAAIKQGKEIHGVVMRNFFHAHLFVANSLLGFYSRCGRIDIANKIFERIPNKNAASWNTMILGYGMIAYGLFDSFATSFFVLAFLGYEKSTGKNPATNLQALLGLQNASLLIFVA